MSMQKTDPALADLLVRLNKLEARNHVRTTLARYMALCDQPCVVRGHPQLGELFAEDAIWEGVGKRYAATFGRQAGRAAIVSFLMGYLAPNPHFQRNLHFLTSEQIAINEDATQADGQWLMLQMSSYGHGGSEAISARLDIRFIRDADGSWVMSRFQTERLDCVPWPGSQNQLEA